MSCCSLLLQPALTSLCGPLMYAMYFLQDPWAVYFSISIPLWTFVESWCIVVLPWENARRASGWCNFPLASAAAGSPHIRTPPSPQPEWARAPEAAAPLTLSCLSEEQAPSGDLHAEAGPNPNLNPGSCANKEEKGKSLPAASEAAD